MQFEEILFSVFPLITTKNFFLTLLRLYQNVASSQPQKITHSILPPLQLKSGIHWIDDLQQRYFKSVNVMLESGVTFHEQVTSNNASALKLEGQSESSLN